MASPNPYEPPRENEGNNPSPSPVELSPDLHHIATALQYAFAEHDDGSGNAVQIHGKDVCRMVLQIAFGLTSFDPTGTEAILYLKELNILRSEDVGDGVYQLIEAGLIRASENDRPDDFAGLFDLTKPIYEWKVGWDIE